MWSWSHYPNYVSIKKRSAEIIPHQLFPVWTYFPERQEVIQYWMHRLCFHLCMLWGKQAFKLKTQTGHATMKVFFFYQKLFCLDKPCFTSAIRVWSSWLNLQLFLERQEVIPYIPLLRWGNTSVILQINVSYKIFFHPFFDTRTNTLIYRSFRIEKAFHFKFMQDLAQNICSLKAWMEY